MDTKIQEAPDSRCHQFRYSCVSISDHRSIHLINLPTLAELKFMPTKQRNGLIEEWYNKGGVLLMGYDNFRNCVRSADNAENEDVLKWLQKPGPSMTIIDEGHKIKNAKSQLSTVVKNIETPFRLCMTGYPLQNNLEEYYTMIDFIYPGFLGTIGEFRNAYKNPIEHFYEDTTPADMMISRRQLYKLRKLLSDLIHRYVSFLYLYVYFTI